MGCHLAIIHFNVQLTPNFYLLAQLLWWIVVQFTQGIAAGLPKDQSWKCHKMPKAVSNAPSVISKMKRIFVTKIVERKTIWHSLHKNVKIIPTLLQNISFSCNFKDKILTHTNLIGKSIQIKNDLTNILLI